MAMAAANAPRATYNCFDKTCNVGGRENAAEIALKLIVVPAALNVVAQLRLKSHVEHDIRIQKVLEDANLKLASVASNTLGKSGRAILAAIIGGEESCDRLADLALGHLRTKIPQLQAAPVSD